MSFSSIVKNELCRLENTENCCAVSELAAALCLNGSAARAPGGGCGIRITTENAAFARRIYSSIKKLFGINPEVTIRKSRKFKKHVSYILYITPAGGSGRLLKAAGVSARRIFIISAAAAAAVSLVCYAGVSREIKVCNKYQTVFYGILKDSPDPAGDLAELGLDPAFAVLAGTNYFMEEYPLDIRTPEFKEMLFEKVGYADVAGFYLRHPGRLLEKLEIAAENGFKLRQGFGNYEKYPGVRYKQTADVFCFWSNFKMNVLPHTLLFVFAFYAASVLILIYEYRKADTPGTRFLTAFFGFIVLMGATQFVLPVLGDGEADLSKHLFLFNISFDLLFAAGLAYFSQKAAVAARYIAEYIRNKRLGSAPE